MKNRRLERKLRLMCWGGGPSTSDDSFTTSLLRLSTLLESDLIPILTHLTPLCMLYGEFREPQAILNGVSNLATSIYKIYDLASWSLSQSNAFGESIMVCAIGCWHDTILLKNIVGLMCLDWRHRDLFVEMSSFCSIGLKGELVPFGESKSTSREVMLESARRRPSIWRNREAIALIALWYYTLPSIII